MELVTPGIGLLFWMLLTFSIVVFVLKKFAWKPILSMLKEREDFIDNALKSANNARAEMEKLQADNEVILKQARSERDGLLTEAREMKDKIINEAKIKAQEEASKIIDNAKNNIEIQKNAAIAEMKQQISAFSIEIAKKILEKELSDESKQKEYLSKLIDELNIN